MNSIKESDMNDFIKWAEENRVPNIYQGVDKEAVSYYVNRETEDTYMMEYGFKTMEELRRCLWQFDGTLLDADILKKLVIQICQNRYTDELKMNNNWDYLRRNHKGRDTENILPEYVYTL